MGFDSLKLEQINRITQIDIFSGEIISIWNYCKDFYIDNLSNDPTDIFTLGCSGVEMKINPKNLDTNIKWVIDIQVIDNKTNKKHEAQIILQKKEVSMIILD